MSLPSVERKLAAIFAADVAAYSRLIGQDEAGTLARLKTCRAVIDQLIADHRGRIFNTAGDSVVADFASAVDALQCAVAVQTSLADKHVGSAGEPMLFRIGIHVGDVVVDGTNLLGDGVNIAARLEGLAEPGGICVSGAVRDQVGNKLPLGFDDLGDQQVKNIAQAIRVYRVQTGTLGVPPVVALPLPDKPSIAVLPFRNMSGDPEQDYFADGMVEEIITALSRIRRLLVIARKSTFTYRGQAIDVKQVGRELGVRYVLEGSVRKAGGRVRITAQLIEAETGAHLWADRFDGALQDVFELQDQIASSVAGIIEPALQAAEIHRTAGRRTDDLTVYDLYLRALRPLFSASQDGVLTALGFLREAIKRDPNYAPALASAASCHLQFELIGMSTEPEPNRSMGIDYARRALAVAKDDPDTLAVAAVTLAYFGEDIGTMLNVIDRALQLNPNSARGWHFSANLRLWAGDAESAIEHLERSARLSPRARFGPHYLTLGLAYLMKQRFDEAASTLRLAIQEQPTSPHPYRALAVCYAHMGRLAEAGEMIERLRTLTPRVVPAQHPWRITAQREMYLSGLRLAMGEQE